MKNRESNPLLCNKTQIKSALSHLDRHFCNKKTPWAISSVRYSLATSVTKPTIADLTTREADLMINVAINGYGRIGRNVLRAFYERPELLGRMQIVAINDLGSAQMNAHLTQFDTTHGRFNQSVSVDKADLVIGSDRIRMLSERDPTQLP